MAVYTRTAPCGVIFERGYEIHARTALATHLTRCKQCKEQK